MTLQDKVVTFKFAGVNAQETPEGTIQQLIVTAWVEDENGELKQLAHTLPNGTNVPWLFASMQMGVPKAMTPNNIKSDNISTLRRAGLVLPENKIIH